MHMLARVSNGACCEDDVQKSKGFANGGSIPIAADFCWTATMHQAAFRYWAK